MIRAAGVVAAVIAVLLAGCASGGSVSVVVGVDVDDGGDGDGGDGVLRHADGGARWFAGLPPGVREGDLPIADLAVASRVVEVHRRDTPGFLYVVVHGIGGCPDRIDPVVVRTGRQEVSVRTVPPRPGSMEVCDVAPGPTTHVLSTPPGVDEAEPLIVRVDDGPAADLPAPTSTRTAWARWTDLVDVQQGSAGLDPVPGGLSRLGHLRGVPAEIASLAGSAEAEVAIGDAHAGRPGLLLARTSPTGMYAVAYGSSSCPLLLEVDPGETLPSYGGLPGTIRLRQVASMPTGGPAAPRGCTDDLSPSTSLLPLPPETADGAVRVGLGAGRGRPSDAGSGRALAVELPVPAAGQGTWVWASWTTEITTGTLRSGETS